MRLSGLATGEEGIIANVRGRGAFRRRISEMGFIRGKLVKVIKNAPLKDPIEYCILGYRVSLRRSEAEMIEVVSIREQKIVGSEGFDGVTIEDLPAAGLLDSTGEINVVLVGNPNAGKTSVFNYASRSHERVGNYGGVTVSSKTARFKHDGYKINLIDLPGTYSLSAYSPEELFVRDYIIDEVPDVVINIVDASNLERNLYLTTQLIDMDMKVVISLNMYDELEKKNDELDFAKLGKMIGIPIIPTVGARGRGLKELFDKVISVHNDKEPIVRHIHINYGKEIERSLSRIQKIIKNEKNFRVTDRVSSRLVAIKLLEKDAHIHRFIVNSPDYKEIITTARRETDRLEEEFRERSETVIAEARYGFISGALKENYKPGVLTKRQTTEILDSFFTHKLFGFPLFFFFMYIMFSSTFNLGNYPMRWIELGVENLSIWLSGLLAPGSFKDLLIDGIIGGVGGVIVFLPNILILFFFISLMEDTGYMARVVFIMDKVMHKIGLHGKSFIPLIMGFGCNVPAIMATRTIENRSNRLLTILINPFMSCSARLPVYLLLIGAVFPEFRGTMLFFLYFTGIFLAVLVAMIFNKFVFKEDDVPFVMELPPYRLPTLKSITKHMWYKGVQYLQKMGGVILVASILIWALGYFPRNEVQHKGSIRDESLPELSSVELEPAEISGTGPAEGSLSTAMEVSGADSTGQHRSYIYMLGNFIEPAIRPLGFDWKMGVALITGIAAKEVVVSTMGVLYHAETDVQTTSLTLSEKIKDETYNSGLNEGEKVFTPLTTLSFLLFVLIYFPCVAVVAAISKETGSWKWAAFAVFYTTGLAYLVSFMVYQAGSLLGF